MLVGEEFTAASVATLYLITDEYGVVCFAEFLDSVKEVLVHQSYATYALNAFDDAGADVALVDFCFPCAEVIDG